MLKEVEDYAKEAKAADEALMLFYARWCGYCSAFRPCFTEIGGKSPRNFVLVDVSEDEHPAWDELGIERVPTIILWRNGKIVDRKSGGLDKNDLAKFLLKNGLS